MFADIAVSDFGGGIVRKDAEASFDASDIRWRLIDQEIDVFREPARAVCDDGKAADQQ